LYRDKNDFSFLADRFITCCALVVLQASQKNIQPKNKFMKLLVITSIKEDLKTVSSIMEKAGIPVFSVSEIIGHKTEHHDYLSDNWFGKNDEGTDSLFFFSYTESEKASNALQIIREYNEVNQSGFPIRVFISPVEDATF
jgi:nitrogen regulatory protein PII